MGHPQMGPLAMVELAGGGDGPETWTEKESVEEFQRTSMEAAVTEISEMKINLESLLKEKQMVKEEVRKSLKERAEDEEVEKLMQFAFAWEKTPTKATLGENSDPRPKRRNTNSKPDSTIFGRSNQKTFLRQKHRSTQKAFLRQKQS